MSAAVTSRPLGLPAVPRVSVVIPTRNRAALLARAIRSVLAQTLRSFEILVVLDGEDGDTENAVERLRREDERIRLIVLPEALGGGAARNAGVLAAQGRWIAFLDDDDEFLPGKLETQWRVAEAQADDSTLVVSRAYVRGDGAEKVWPRRFAAEGESVCEYLFCRRRLRQGDSLLQSSTFFVSRRLALEVPFRADLVRHQDWDWAIRLQRAGTRIVGVDEPLSVYHAGTQGGSVSRRRGWQDSFTWGRCTVLPESRRAYSFFIATQCVTRLGVEDCRKLATICVLAKECFRAGRATPIAMVLFGYLYLRRVIQTWPRRQRLEPMTAIVRA